ncbi:heterokaryon incompatibility protein (HET) domain-containing protein [Trichoderma breve]|uniref:Heterokaryon incompatibility protein (HET) domain-containing protein n=1 Tax=Trichoderma breve TaxID=2034170 RepID=A0A9W9EF65_9HYPO|nr:heterokaryon incompatibility protein (HET) domain-containing protein [Trichoderma breve]KAJ4865447.1 heterokaryon incompatibility protein (HET) domain-containing protein [Trichoderma breve]
MCTGMDPSHYCLGDASKEIRLFDLVSANEQEPAQGRIRRAIIGDAPPFAAVSHVWGDKSRDRSIRLESDSSALIRLLSLRYGWLKGSRLPLWVDMICINQMDVAEKALQIPLMREIYSQASSVIIWINEKDNRIGQAFRYLRHLIANKTTTETADIWPLFDPDGWEGLKYLLDCSWFHRRWVLQEFAVSKDAAFLCGSDVMSIDDLFSGIDMAASVLIARPRKFKILHPAHTGSLRPAPALRELRKHYAEPDYHVYSLLGLCSSEEVAGNPIRYDLEPEEVYKTFVATHARLYNNLEFLGLCTAAQRDSVCSGSMDKSVSRLFAGPSWVPNWHSERLQRCLGLNDYGTNLKFFNASDRVPMAALFRHNELEVSGVRLDRILSIGRFCRLERRHELTDPNSRLFQEYFDFWTRVAAAERIMPYRDKKHLAETIARTLSLLGIYLNPMPLLADIPDMFCRWCRGSNLGRQLTEYGLKPKNATNLEGERVFMGMRRLTAWEPFITESGYIGLARGNSRVGDEIWLVGGCSVPLLLSPQTGDSVGFKVNGEVFFDGFMFGEAMRMDEFGDTSVQQITLV